MPDLWPSGRNTIRVRTQNGWCLAETEGGARVGMVACTGGMEQLWKVDGFEHADGSRFQLKTARSGGGECLDVSGEDGTTIGLWKCGRYRQPNQLFQWRGGRFMSGGACLCIDANGMLKVSVPRSRCLSCLSITIVSSDLRPKAYYPWQPIAVSSPSPAHHAKSDSPNDAITELTRVYDHPPPAIWRSIEDKLEAAEMWTSKSIAMRVGEIEDFELWTGRELQREYVGIDTKSKGFGLPILGFILLALVLCVFYLCGRVCRGIIAGKCDKMLGITVQRGHRKYYRSHIL